MQEFGQFIFVMQPSLVVPGIRGFLGGSRNRSMNDYVASAAVAHAACQGKEST